MSKKKAEPKPAKLPPSLIEELQELRRTMDLTRARIKEIEGEVVKKLGDREWGDFGDPVHFVRYQTINRAEYVVPACTYHVLKVVKRQKEKKDD